MKRHKVCWTLTALAAMMLIALPAMASDQNQTRITIFDAVPVPGGTTVTAQKDGSDFIDTMSGRCEKGNFGIQYEITGNGTVQLHNLVSISGGDYLSPVTAAAIASAISSTTGRAGNGKDIIEYSQEFNYSTKWQAAETTGSYTPTITVWGSCN